MRLGIEMLAGGLEGLIRFPIRERNIETERKELVQESVKWVRGRVQ
jgi:hypothetical protein